MDFKENLNKILKIDKEIVLYNKQLKDIETGTYGNLKDDETNPSLDVILKDILSLLDHEFVIGILGGMGIFSDIYFFHDIVKLLEKKKIDATVVLLNDPYCHIFSEPILMKDLKRVDSNIVNLAMKNIRDFLKKIFIFR